MSDLYVKLAYEDSEGLHEVGDVVDFPDAEAIRLIDQGILTTTKPPEAKPKETPTGPGTSRATPKTPKKDS